MVLALTPNNFTSPPPPVHTGVMICFYLPPEIAQFIALSIPGALPPEELHITLCYLGKAPELGMPVLEKLAVLMQQFSHSFPISGVISGIGMFNTASSEDGTNALYASFDSPAIGFFREIIRFSLLDAGIEVSDTHGFTPHITLAYLPAGEPIPALTLPFIPVTFDRVSLQWAMERTDYGFQPEPPPLPIEEVEPVQYKSTLNAEQRARLKPSDFGDPRGRKFPILDQSDVDGAAHLIGKADNPDAVKSRIIAIAKRKKLTIPKAWQTTKNTVTSGVYGLGGKVANALVLPGGKKKKPVVTKGSANYGAEAGGTIIGNLSRGQDGKFASGGGGGSAAKPKPEDEKIDPAKLAKGDPTEAAKLDRAGAKVDAEQAANPDKKKPGKGGSGKGGGAGAGKPDKGAAQSETLAKLIGKDGAAALLAFSKDPKTPLDPKVQADLLNRGLLERDSRGNIRSSSSARSLLNAAARGDETTSASILSRVQDRAGKRQAALERAQNRTPSKRKDASAFSVFKDATGRWRWLMVSSSAYIDRDGEIVSTKALSDDCDRADLTQRYGPLRVWHVPGWDIGDCDFNAMHGPFLIESGTLRDEAFGPPLARAAKELGVSLGFYHPKTQPDEEGVYHQIFRFERSILPWDSASNLFTGFNILRKETDMEDKKKNFLQRLFGGDAKAEAALTNTLAKADSTQKAADVLGLAMKAFDEENNPVKVPAAKAPPPPMETKAPGDEDPEATEGAAEEFEGSEGDMVIDMTVGGLHQKIDDVIASRLQSDVIKPLMDAIAAVSSSSAATTKEAQTTALVLKEVANVLKGLGEKLGTTTKAATDRMDKLESAIKELNGDVPRSIQQLRASERQDTLLPEGSRLKGAQPVPVDPDYEAIGKMTAALFGGGIPPIS
jgi:2'-5' RNA ligase